jgi:ribosomal protein S18 acetylase RimI-like enzyme
MKIKKATIKDLKSIAEVFRVESAKAPYKKKRTPEKALARIKEDFRGNELYVAIVDDKIVGFVMVSVDSGIKTQLWVNELWILKEQQGKGIGRKLMDEIEKIYKKKGIKIVELVADTRKGGAYGFYKKKGYNLAKNLVFMEKKI